MPSFTLDDTSNLINSGDYEFNIPTDTLDILNDIIKKLNLNDKINNTKVSNSWRGPVHKKTFIKSNTLTGIESSVLSIRRHINKLSDENYCKLSELIINECKTYTDLADIKTLGEKILSIMMMNNSVYAKLYASIYNKFGMHYPIAHDIVKSYIESFETDMHNFNYCNPNVSYDSYCEYIKKNDNRKSVIRMIIQLTNNGFLPVSYILNIIERIQTELIQSNNIIEINEEYTEILYMIILDSQDILSFTEKWEQINTNLLHIMNMKKSEHISNKVIFRHMDIVDMLK